MPAALAGAGRGAPRIHLAVHFADRLFLVERGNIVPAGNPQHRALAQHVDVAAERGGVGPKEGDHGLI
jgi:hypothetical protein